MLCVGLDDGTIASYKLQENYMKCCEVKLILLKVFITQVHQKRVMGLCIDSSANMLYSVSEDKTLKSKDLSNGDIISSI